MSTAFSPSDESMRYEATKDTETETGKEENRARKSCLQSLKKDRNGWIVCFNVIILHLVRTGIFNSFGLFVAEFKKLYGTPMVILNWITLIATFLTSTMSPLTPLIINWTPKNGHFICSIVGSWVQALACLITSFMIQIEWLFLTYGILFGASCSLSLMSSTLILNEFFPVAHRCHVFATSIFQCAFPAGILLFATLYAWLIETVNWRWAIRVASLKLIIIGTICSLSFLLKKPKSDGKVDGRGKTCCRYWVDIFKNPRRICWLLGTLLTMASQVSLLTNLPHYLNVRGFGIVEAGFAITIFGLAQFLTYAMIPFLGVLLKSNLVYTNVVSCLILAILMFVWPLANPSYGIILLFSAIFGIFGASSFAFIYPGSGEAMEMELDVAWTMTCTFSGFGALLGPLLSGLVFDHTNSYDAVFYVLASVTFLNFLIFLAIPAIKYFRNGYEGLA